MNSSEQFTALSEHAKRAGEDIMSASTQSQAELRDRVGNARDSADKRVASLSKGAEDAGKRGSESWHRVRDSWTHHVADVRRQREDRKDERDAKHAEHHAERAERDALIAIEFAYAAFEECEYSVLDAALARTIADEAVAAAA